MNIHIYLNPWAKLIDFDWSVSFPNDVCVIISLLNQMLFVASMNVNSAPAITNWLQVLDQFQGRDGARESSGWKNSPHSIIYLSPSFIFLFQSISLFLCLTIRLFSPVARCITWPLTSPTMLHSTPAWPVPRLPWLPVVTANKRIPDKLCGY